MRERDASSEVTIDWQGSGAGWIFQYRVIALRGDEASIASAASEATAKGTAHADLLAESGAEQ